MGSSSQLVARTSNPPANPNRSGLYRCGKIGSAGVSQTRSYWELCVIVGIPFSRWGAQPFSKRSSCSADRAICNPFNPGMRCWLCATVLGDTRIETRLVFRSLLNRLATQIHEDL